MINLARGRVERSGCCDRQEERQEVQEGRQLGRQFGPRPDREQVLHDVAAGGRLRPPQGPVQHPGHHAPGHSVDNVYHIEDSRYCLAGREDVLLGIFNHQYLN